MVPAVLAVTMTLHKVSRTRSGSRSDHGTFLPADQRAANCSRNAPDYRSLGLTMVVSVWTTVCKAIRSNRQHYEYQNQ
jgi:hypothetical protein